MKDLKADPKILLLGIGNYDWGDDSLGWSFVDKIAGQGYEFLDCQYRYKLKPEDAELLSQYDIIVFVTSSQESLERGFELRTCIAAEHAFYTDDDRAPAAILHLANELYHRSPKAYVLSITGLQWDLQAFLSREANGNMEAAVEFFNEEFLPSVLEATVL